MQSSGLLPLALIVETNEERRNIALVLLEESGLDAYWASNSAEAEAFVKRYAHRVGFLFINDATVDVSGLLRAVKDVTSSASVAVTNMRAGHDPAVIRMCSNWAPLDLLVAAGIAIESYEQTIH